MRTVQFQGGMSTNGLLSVWLGWLVGPLRTSHPVQSPLWHRGKTESRPVTDTVQDFFHRILQSSSGHECLGNCARQKIAQK